MSLKLGTLAGDNLVLSRGYSETEEDLPDGNLDTNKKTKLNKRQNHTVEPEVGLPEPQDL